MTVADMPAPAREGRSRRQSKDVPTIRVRRRGLSGHRLLQYATLLGPAVVIFVVAFAYPLSSVLAKSFTMPSFGLQNYRWFFQTPINLVVLTRTLVTGAWVTVICVVLAYPYAFFMSNVRSRSRAILMLLVLVPFWISGVVRTFAWVILLQGNGPISRAASWLGFGSVSILHTNTAVLIGMAQVLLPFVVLPMYATMSKIDLRLLMAARSLGARPAKAFLKVYVPLSFPGVAAGALLCFILALGFYITPAMLGSTQETLISTLIQSEIQGQLEWGHGSTIAFMLLIATLALLWIAALVTRRTVGSVSDMMGGSK